MVSSGFLVSGLAELDTFPGRVYEPLHKTSNVKLLSK